MQKRLILLLTVVVVSGMIFTSCEKNSPPTVVSVVVNPAVVDPGQSTSVVVTATDPDSDLLTYAYTVNGGAVSGTGPMVNWIAPNSAGAYSLSVTVSDPDGLTAQGNAALTVNEAFTGVSGTAKFMAGTAGDLNNSKVSLYTDIDKWNLNSPIKFGAVTGSGASVNYMLSANPGNYYLDIWKDIDNSGTWTTGDFVGWYGSGGLGSPYLTEIQLSQGQNFQAQITMYIF